MNASKYTLLDRSRLRLRPLAERDHDMSVKFLLDSEALSPGFEHPSLQPVACHLLEAREAGTTRLLMMGAHVIKRGLSRHVIELIRAGLVSHLSTNGAGAIHDLELALCGASTESVARYVRTGEFGLWRETGELNEFCRGAPGRGNRDDFRIVHHGL